MRTRATNLNAITVLVVFDLRLLVCQTLTLTLTRHAALKDPMNDDDIDRMVSDDETPKTRTTRERLREKRRRLMHEWAAEMADARFETQRARWGND